MTGPPRTDPERGLEGRLRTAALVGGVLVVTAGLVLRFWTRSGLWLDEALTVDIARLPVHEIPGYLKRDGAPPLFYVLLHFWMGMFGSSPAAVRTLSGVLSVATIPMAWIAAKRFGGDRVAAVIVLVLATAPFAVYYGTESRMYALVMFLVACGFVALPRALERPTPLNLVSVAFIVAALLYTQYWGIYLAASMGAWLSWRTWRHRREERRSAKCLLAVVVGCLAFVPWLPTFEYQSIHTGTPWAKPSNFAAVIGAVTGFTDNQGSNLAGGSNQGRLLALFYFALAGLALFGTARDRWRIELDIRTRPGVRGPAFLFIVTLFLAVIGGIVSGSAYSVRYAGIVFVPLVILVAYGTKSFSDARIRAAVVAVVVAAGLAVAVENVWTQRTEGIQVARTIQSGAAAGDVVAFCPDQLGPSVYRVLSPTQTGGTGEHGRYDLVTFPRDVGPAFVDWVTYLKVAQAATPGAFETKLVAAAGSGHAIWVVSAIGYQGYGLSCQILVTELSKIPGWTTQHVIAQKPTSFYESMSLTEFTPPRPKRAG